MTGLSNKKLCLAVFTCILLAIGATKGLDIIAYAAPAPTNFQPTTWDDLMPKGWDPMEQIRKIKVGLIQDDDPRAPDIARQIRRILDDAPPNPIIEGQSIRISGYLVPLEEQPAETKEFLLVPYMGACIHSPPPPSNQIIHVTLAKPVKGLHMMDALTVSGTIKSFRGDDTYMGVSGYKMVGYDVAPFVPGK